MGASAAGCGGTDKQAADLELRGRLSVCLSAGGRGRHGVGESGAPGQGGGCSGAVEFAREMPRRDGRRRHVECAVSVGPYAGEQGVWVAFCLGPGPVLKEV